MAVVEGKRGEGKFTVLVEANELAVHTIKVTRNTKIFLPEYQTALTNDIIHTAKEIYIKCWTANNIKVGNDKDKWKKRKELQEDAANECNNLLALIYIAKRLFHLRAGKVKYWSEKVLKVRQLIRDWKESDQRRYGSLA